MTRDEAIAKVEGISHTAHLFAQPAFAAHIVDALAALGFLHLKPTSDAKWKLVGALNADRAGTPSRFVGVSDLAKALDACGLELVKNNRSDQRCYRQRGGTGYCARHVMQPDKPVSRDAAFLMALRNFGEVLLYAGVAFAAALILLLLIERLRGR